MPLIVFLVCVLAGVVIFFCVARKYVWGPRAVDRELVRQLQAAGIETRILRKPRLGQRFPLAREWTTPLPVEQAGASLREKLNVVPGLEVYPQTDGGLIVHSRQKQSLRGGPPHEITFAEARFAFDSQGVSGARIRCEVKFEVSQALVITVVVALAFAGRFLIFARPGARGTAVLAGDPRGARKLRRDLRLRALAGATHPDANLPGPTRS